MKLSNPFTFLLTSLILALSIAGCMKPADNETSSQQTDLAIAKKVKDLMGEMSLIDKVGEMTQYTIDVISVGGIFNLTEPHQLDTAKLRRILLDQRIGSIINVNHAYTREHWHEIIKGIQDIATKEKPTGIPVLYGVDAYHGNNYTVGSTLFPQPLAMAATWNTDLVEKISVATAYETRASWIPWNFAPVLDIGRDPRWPRFWETLGEDVLLSSDMGAAYVKGMQGDDLAHPERVAACIKHFLGYSVPLTGKDRTQALIPDRQLREYHVPPFQRGVDAGAATLMVCSGEINGVPVHGSKAILTDLLRSEMGFTGLVVSDWDDITNLHTRHRIAKDYKESIEIAINAGIDMVMVPIDTTFPVLLRELAEEGKIPMFRIDQAVERILTVKYKLGLFENPYPADHDYSKFASQEHADLSFQAALETVILLKNENKTLPLSKEMRVLVTGPAANSMIPLNGGWNRTWQGNSPTWDLEEDKKTVLEAIQDKIGAGNVTYIEGSTFDEAVNLQVAAQAATRVDAVIVCLGESSYAETPGDIDDLILSAAQRQLVEAVAKSGKPIIGVLIQGRPRLINDFEKKTAALLTSNLPGNEGGRAIAEVLFGDYNPNGKLPYTYPRFANSLTTYDQRYTDMIGPKGFNPQFEFGHGLSYTTFAYSDFKLGDTLFSMDGQVKVEVKVSNTGQRAGMEVVQLYVSDKVASITPSVKRLRAYQKIALEPGESKVVSFTITPKQLAFIGMDNKWVTEPGEFEFTIGSLKETATLK